jgi:hypothetical protein
VSPPLSATQRSEGGHASLATQRSAQAEQAKTWPEQEPKQKPEPAPVFAGLHTITVPPGNYNGAELATVVQQQIRTHMDAYQNEP